MRIFTLIVLLCCAFSVSAKEIIHDAEHYILEAQHGKKWATEDKALDERLAELKKKFGTPPNIIHIMWDDMAVGEVGIPEIQAVRGFKTPNINKMAEDGINFMRMYTERPVHRPARLSKQAVTLCARECTPLPSLSNTQEWMQKKSPSPRS